MLAADDRDAASTSGWLNAVKKERKEELIQVLTGKMWLIHKISWVFKMFSASGS